MKYNIINIVSKYIEGSNNNEFHRYKSWENCNNYFNTTSLNENHSLHLAFYLASWGMYRGSCGLLQLNHLVHENAVKILYSKNYSFIKCNSLIEVSENEIDKIIELKNCLMRYYNSIKFSKANSKPRTISTTDTLISKIMLGTMACVPAYDRYFISGLAVVGMKHKTFDKNSICELFTFIDRNIIDIQNVQKIIFSKTNIHYPMMKILDMYFWQIGFDKPNN